MRKVCTEMTVVLQRKACILGKLKQYISCVISVTRNDKRNFLSVQSHSPVHQIKTTVVPFSHLALLSCSWL